MSYTTFNQDDIDNNINEIFTECLIQNFIDTIDCDYYDWYEFNSDENYCEYFEDSFIDNVFNSSHMRDSNIFYYYDKDYTLDFKTTIILLKYIKYQLVDNFNCEESFCDMFDDDVNSQTKIINNYAYFYIRENWRDIYISELTDNWKITKIFINIAKYNFHKNKHNKLINLYEKLDKKNKQKKTIIKILNDKFDTDIIQNIICAY